MFEFPANEKTNKQTNHYFRTTTGVRQIEYLSSLGMIKIRRPQQ